MLPIAKRKIPFIFFSFAFLKVPSEICFYDESRVLNNLQVGLVYRLESLRARAFNKHKMWGSERITTVMHSLRLMKFKLKLCFYKNFAAEQ